MARRMRKAAEHETKVRRKRIGRMVAVNVCNEAK